MSDLALFSASRQAADSDGEFTLQGLEALIDFEAALERLKTIPGSSPEDGAVFLEVGMVQLHEGVLALANGQHDDAVLMM